MREKAVFNEIFNSDNMEFGGNGWFSNGKIISDDLPYMGNDFSINIKLPPLSGVIFKVESKEEVDK